MKWVGVFAVLLVLGLLAWRVTRPTANLAAGDAAPGFLLTDQNGAVHQLSDYRGRWLVLYFYPKDDTPGCTREACRFRDDIASIRSLNAEVVGISVDDTASHAAFAAKYHLPFPLLADKDGNTAAAYGALLKLGPLRLARRHTFIVAPGGRIAQAFRQIDPERHALEIAQALRALQTINPEEAAQSGR